MADFPICPLIIYFNKWNACPQFHIPEAWKKYPFGANPRLIWAIEGSTHLPRVITTERGTSQLYLRVAWTSAFKQSFSNRKFMVSWSWFSLSYWWDSVASYQKSINKTLQTCGQTEAFPPSSEIKKTNFPLSFTEGRIVSVIFAWHWRSLLFSVVCHIDMHASN